jgi:hypothetical protein
MAIGKLLSPHCYAVTLQAHRLDQTSLPEGSAIATEYGSFADPHGILRPCHSAASIRESGT